MPVSAQELAGQLAYHQTLLGDRRRNEAFARALADRVRPGDAVVDVGSGSGIWAVVAARCGARRVVAIEREPLLCTVIERLARENGVGDRVEVVCADALKADLNREFDVAISETVGTTAFEEGIVGLMAHSRDHFVRPGGILIPERVGLQAAPVSLPAIAAGDLKTASFKALANHVPHWVLPGRIRTLARAQSLLTVDMHRAASADPLPHAHVEFSVEDASKVAGLGLWVDLRLAPGIRLSTRSSTHWGATVLPIEPPSPGPALLKFDVDWNPQRRRWAIEIAREGRPHTRAEHSPLFALSSLQLATRA